MGRVSSALSVILVVATLVQCLQVVQCAMYISVNGAVTSMSVGAVANKAVLIMGRNVVMGVIRVSVTTAKMSMLNSVSCVMNITV
mmetsp:Transcript_28618/g.40875  ORF Transcript_28618/g.40875 Transcript_28618/m.40875 type:complete len:85 (+) Transcript_28618:878-1132(+)